MSNQNYVFPKIDLPTPKRSNHNLGKPIVTSFTPGTLIPLWSKPMLPGDRFKIDLNGAVESMPMLGPLYGRWKVHFAFYFCQDQNLYGFMRNDERRGTADIINQSLFSYTLPMHRKIPATSVGVITRAAATLESDKLKVAPNSVWEHLGWPAGYMGYVLTDPSSTQQSLQNLAGAGSSQIVPELWTKEIPDTYEYRHQMLNAHFPFHYLNILRHYYVNKQSKEVPFIKDSSTKDYSGVVEFVSLDVLDNVFRRLQNYPADKIVEALVDENGLAVNSWLNLSTWMDDVYTVESPADLDVKTSQFMQSWEETFNVPNGGLFCVPFNMDLNRGMLNAEVGSYRAEIDTSQGVVAVETIWEKNKMQHLINILDISGGRWSDALNTLWDVSVKTDISKPLYLGSLTTYVAQKDIVSNVSSSNSPQGNQTGYTQGGFQFTKKNKVSIYTEKPGVVICVMTMIPDVLYSQGFKRDYLATNMRGVYNPQMSRLGYEDVPAFVLNAQTLINQYYVGDDELLDDYGEPLRDVCPALPHISVGKQVAWAGYMSDVGESRGHFAYDQSLEFWVLNRVYNNTRVSTFTDETEGITNYVYNPKYDFSTYVFPWEYQNLFAVTDPTAQNFRVWCNFDVFARRPIPKRTLPGM